MKTDLSAQVKTLLSAAEQGDVKALHKVRALMPDYRQYVQDKYGDLGKMTERLLIHHYSGDQLPLQDGLRHGAERVRQALEGPAPTPLERLLIERIVCCWIHAHFTEIHAVMRDRPPKEQEPYDKARDRATRRFLAACKALAQVRRLLGPTVQINVAERQVNVA